MPAFNFAAQFAPDVEAGRKLQTIRKERKDCKVPAEPGQRLALYTGMRSPACRLLRETVAKTVTPIFIDTAGRAIWRSKIIGPYFLDHHHKLLSPAKTDGLILADGFARPDDFWAFFANGGRHWLITWPPIVGGKVSP